MLTKATEVLRTHGLPGLWRALRRRILALRPRERRWVREHYRADRAFDHKYGVQTAGFVASAKAGQVAYIPISEAEFEAAISALPGTADFTFVDLGCGKGKALLLASFYRWQRIVGVEYQKALYWAAESNRWSWEPEQQRTRAIEVVCADAGEYEFPAVPLVVYLYNPFGEEVMSRVARNLADSYQRHPRPIWVIYVNPWHKEPWVREGFEVKDCGWGVLMRPGR